MGKVGKIVRWVSLKTAAQLAECSTDAVRLNVRRKRWQARRIGSGRRGHLRVAIGLDNWPVGGRTKA